MDPVSRVFGTEEVVSLAIEIAKIAGKAHHTIASLKSAPKEVRGLAERLEMLQSLCGLIGLALQKRQIDQGQDMPELDHAFDTALRQCRDRLRELEKMTSKLGRSLFSMKIRFLFQKEKWGRLTKHLDSLVSSIQLGLKVDLWYVTSPSEPISWCAAKAVVLDYGRTVESIIRYDDRATKTDGSTTKDEGKRQRDAGEKTREVEELLLKMRAKLFEFNRETHQWQERGSGDVRLLKHKENGKSRLVMRRDRTFKVCANHYILPGMILIPTKGCERSWLWTAAADESGGEVKTITFAIRFFDSSRANLFREVFTKARKDNESLFGNVDVLNEEKQSTNTKSP